MPQVGYGQTVPVSTPGKIIAAFTMLFGILLIALPMAIVPDLLALGHALHHANHDSVSDGNFHRHSNFLWGAKKLAWVGWQ